MAKILVKASNTASDTPSTSQATTAELCLNTKDRKLYAGTDTGGSSSPGSTAGQVTLIGAYIDTGTVATGSNDRLASQGAIKTYADTKAPIAGPSFTGNATFAGDVTIDANNKFLKTRQNVNNGVVDLLGMNTSSHVVIGPSGYMVKTGTGNIIDDGGGSATFTGNIAFSSVKQATSSHYNAGNYLITKSAYTGTAGGHFDVYYDNTHTTRISAGAAGGDTYFNGGNSFVIGGTSSSYKFQVNGTSYISGNATFGGSITGNLTGNASGSSASCTGTAANATVLSNTRTFRTNLASTSTSNFNGSQNPTPGVTGTLPVSNGGTGQTGATGSGKLVLWNSPDLQGSPIIGGTTMPSSTGSSKQILSITGTGSAGWIDNVKYGYTTLAYQAQWYASAKKWYSCSSSYGANYYNWNKSWTTAVPDNWDYAHGTSSLKSYGMPIVVPISGSIHSWGWHGVYNSSSTYFFRILKGDPTYGNSQTGIAISTVGSEVSASASSGRFVKVETASTQSVTRGDIIVPVMKNNSTSTSTKYGRGQFYITFKVDLSQ